MNQRQGRFLKYSPKRRIGINWDRRHEWAFMKIMKRERLEESRAGDDMM